MKTIRILINFILITLAIPAMSQFKDGNPYPSVGDSLPDHMFTDLDNFPSKTLKLSDYKGKWLILDFWGYSCTACIASFPKMNEISSGLPDSIKLVMVGATKAEANQSESKFMEIEKITKNTYFKRKKEYGLTFTVAFDSVLYIKYGVGALPQILIIDPTGKIVAKTTSITSKNIADLVSGGKPAFKRSYSRKEVRGKYYKPELPLLTSGNFENGGFDTNFYFRSMLAPYDEDLPMHGYIDINKKNNKNVKEGRLEIFHLDLPSLYRVAYFGRNSWSAHDTSYFNHYAKTAILNIPDTSLFKKDQKKYLYSLVVPKEKSSREFLMKCMQDDLQRYFGYRARKELRMMPVYFLEVADRKKIEKLRTKKGISGYKASKIVFQGNSETNVTINDFFVRMVANQFITYDEPFFDRTGIDFNLDFTINADFLNEKEVVKELNRLGFKLVRGEKMLETIVIEMAN